MALNDDKYDQVSAREHYADLEKVKRAPISERRESCAEFTEVMRDNPDLVGERLGWLLEGCYGRGAMQAALHVLATGKNANKVASLNLLIAALEWSCPADMTIRAWKMLTEPQKVALDAAIQRVLQNRKNEQLLADVPRLMSAPHGLCDRSRTCLEHTQNPSVSNCKPLKRDKGRKTS